MEEQARDAREDSPQELAKYSSHSTMNWRNVALLKHFNCFAVSETRNDARNGAYVDLQVEGSSGQTRKGGWKTLPYIIGNDSCEKLAVVGLAANLIIYLTTKYNMSNVEATNVLNIWSGSTSLGTLVGAFLADSYLGRFRTILIGCLSYLVGVCLLTLTALIPRLRPPPCSMLGKCEGASKEQWALLVFVFLFITIGSAGIRPCSITFGADQFQQEGPKGKKSLQSFFNWYYFSTCAALILALTLIVYIQNMSWSVGFGVCCLLMLVSTVVFLLGSPVFLYEVPKGSPFTGFVRVTVATIRKLKLPLPSDPEQLYYDQSSPKASLTDRIRFLNKAAIIREGDVLPDGSVANRWKLCSIQQVEAMKSIIATMPIFSCGIANSITSAQEHTFSILQAQSMNRRLGSTTFKVPAASFAVFSLLTLFVWLPFYDQVIVRAARRVTKRSQGITVLQRMGIGFALSSLSMFVAGFVEVKRRNTAINHGLAEEPRAMVPISAMWLLPQFCISGLAGAFHVVGYLEFLYGQFPANMRSTAIALSSCTGALGSYLSSVVVTVVHNTTGRNGKPDWLDHNLNRGRLEYFYWLLSAMEALNLIYFFVCASWFKYTESPPPLVHEVQKSDVSIPHEMDV